MVKLIMMVLRKLLMYKIMSTFFFVLMVPLTVAAVDRESWMYLGFESSFAQETNSEATRATMDSVGINFSVFSFRDRNDFGFYVHDSFLFPQSGTLTHEGSTTKTDLGVYDFLASTEIILGPGYRHKISDSSSLVFGLGFHFMMMSGFYTKYIPYYGEISYSLFSYNMGVGGDLALKIDLTDVLFFIGGSSFAYDPYNFTSVTVNGETASSRPAGYSYFAFHPFLAFGINLYQTAPAFGRPE